MGFVGFLCLLDFTFYFSVFTFQRKIFWLRKTRTQLSTEQIHIIVATSATNFNLIFLDLKMILLSINFTNPIPDLSWLIVIPTTQSFAHFLLRFSTGSCLLGQEHSNADYLI